MVMVEMFGNFHNQSEPREWPPIRVGECVRWLMLLWLWMLPFFSRFFVLPASRTRPGASELNCLLGGEFIFSFHVL